MNPLRRAYNFLAPWKKTGLRANHYHWFVTIGLIVVFAAGVGLGSGATYVVATDHGGGFKPSATTHVISLKGGPNPSASNMFKFVVRIHNQDSFNSCVAQTGSAITEIVQAERGNGIPISAGYLYNQGKLFGGDNGMSYQELGYLMTTQGDAPLSAFPYDGVGDIYTQPWDAARSAAWPYRFVSWHEIEPTDIYTIEYEISHGKPIGVAMAIYSSFLAAASQGATVYIDSQGGIFEFYHSMTGVGYDATGLWLLNSWGGTGYIHISWSLLAQYSNGGLFDPVAQPYTPKPKPKPSPKPFPRKAWCAWATGHHVRCVNPRDAHHRLTWPAAIFAKERQKRHMGGFVRERYYPRMKGRKHAFMRYDYGRTYAIAWFDFHAYKVYSKRGKKR